MGLFGLCSLFRLGWIRICGLARVVWGMLVSDCLGVIGLIWCYMSSRMGVCLP